MLLRGRVWKFGANVDTDAIVPARYLNTSEPQALARHCMEDLDPGFAQKVRPGDIIVAGANFGCGSSREHAPVAIKAAGIACVIASSFARIFFRNAINIGLPILICPEAAQAIAQGDEVEVDLVSGSIRDLTSGVSFQAQRYPEFMLRIIEAGGLVEKVRKDLSARGAIG
jgi:3-isopropylmalate dehydratase small subunit